MKLTAADRKRFNPRVFGLPKSRKYPMPDKAHAANAEARATQQVNAGNLSVAEKAQIDRKAKQVLGK